jgi:hypothetical protein
VRTLKRVLVGKNSMPSDSEQQELLAKKMVLLAKELRHANLQLSEFAVIKNSLEAVVFQIQEMSEKLQSDSSLAGFFERELQNQQILELFNQLQAQLAGMKQQVLLTEERLLNHSVFLERYRSYRHYSFSDSQKTLSFLSQLAELYGLESFLFKPAFVGLVSFEPVKKELEMEKKEESTYRIPVSKVPELFNYLLSKKFVTNFRLDSEPVRVLCKNPREIKIESHNSIIKRLDRVVISLEGKVLDS